MRKDVRNTKFTKNTKGVTLIEALVSVGLFVVISLALFGVYEAFGKLYFLGSANLTAVGGSRASLTQVANLTSQAYRVLESRSVNGVNYSTTSSTLVLQLPSIDSSGKTIDNTWDYAVFYVSSTSFYRYLEKSAASARVNGSKTLTDSLQSVIFTYDNADFTQVRKVMVEIFTRAVENRVPVESRASEQIFLKNY